VRARRNVPCGHNHARPTQAPLGRSGLSRRARELRSRWDRFPGETIFLEAAAQLGSCRCSLNKGSLCVPGGTCPSVTTTPGPPKLPLAAGLNPKNARAALPHRIGVGIGVRRPARALLVAPWLWADRPQSPHGRASPPPAAVAAAPPTILLIKKRGGSDGYSTLLFILLN
jgi:hypothetical protein